MQEKKEAINSKRGPSMKQCCLCGKNKTGKEKCYYFTYTAQDTTYSHLILTKGKEWVHEKKGVSKLKQKINKKEQEKVKIN